MNTRQLEYFLTVAKCRSLTVAARELNVAQPTLTKTIHALEAELGVELFARLPRGVALTRYGSSLLRHANAIRNQVNDAHAEISFLHGDAHGSVVIGAGPAWLRRLLPQAVAKVAAGNPGVKIKVEGGFDDALLKALRQGDLDFVVAELPGDEVAKDLEMLSLTSDSFAACCRKGHPLVGAGNIPLARLQDCVWAMPPSATRAHQRLRAFFVAADLPPPEAVVETESLAFMLQFLLYSDALTLTVATTLDLPEATGLTKLDVPALDSERKAGIISRKDGWLSPAATAIIDELKAICAKQERN
ncbi:MAG: LysR family transcriptional regulator [Alphaproteobacteria bacterium]|nr:LysR family transcriptional regulator [Alphaproteobacteria bacterium]